MSQIITYKCDRCGKESIEKSTLNLKIVGIGVKEEKYSSYQCHTYTLDDEQRREAEWCQECRTTVGLNNPQKEDSPPPSPPSLEEMIREIIREEIAER